LARYKAAGGGYARRSWLWRIRANAGLPDALTPVSHVWGFSKHDAAAVAAQPLEPTVAGPPTHEQMQVSSSVMCQHTLIHPALVTCSGGGGGASGGDKPHSGRRLCGRWNWMWLSTQTEQMQVSPCLMRPNPVDADSMWCLKHAATECGRQHKTAGRCAAAELDMAQRERGIRTFSHRFRQVRSFRVSALQLWRRRGGAAWTQSGRRQCGRWSWT